MTGRWRCSRYQRLLVDYADDAVAGRAKRRVEAHLRGCTRCTDDLAALRTLPTQLLHCGAPGRSDEFWEAQRRSIAATIRHLPRERPRHAWVAVLRWQPALTAIASVLLAVGVYRFSALHRVHTSPRLLAPSDVASLDNPTLDHLIDVMAAFTPQDDYLQQSAADEDGGSLGVEGFRRENDEPLPNPPLNALDDEELDGLADLVGIS